MSLSIIGAGLGRTGTTSLEAALGQLGIGSFYDVRKLINLPDHWPLWMSALDGKTIDWDMIFDDFDVTTAAPGCAFYRQLADHYPKARVILTVRDADRWFKSTQSSVFSPVVAEMFHAMPPAFNALMHKMGVHPDDPNNHDRVGMIARMQAHNEEVRASIAPDRLLVYEVAQGWEPLCDFLGLAVPDAPFPRVHTTDEFQKMVAGTPSLRASATKSVASIEAHRRDPQ